MIWNSTNCYVFMICDSLRLHYYNIQRYCIWNFILHLSYYGMQHNGVTILRNTTWWHYSRHITWNDSSENTCYTVECSIMEYDITRPDDTTDYHIMPDNTFQTFWHWTERCLCCTMEITNYKMMSWIDFVKAHKTHSQHQVSLKIRLNLV